MYAAWPPLYTINMYNVKWWWWAAWLHVYSRDLCHNYFWSGHILLTKNGCVVTYCSITLGLQKWKNVRYFVHTANKKMSSRLAGLDVWFFCGAVVCALSVCWSTKFHIIVVRTDALYSDSPGFESQPGDYNPHWHCVWFFSVSSGRFWDIISHTSHIGRGCCFLHFFPNLSFIISCHSSFYNWGSWHI